MKELIDTSDRLVASVSTDFHRYLSSEIDWNGRLICIKWASGTGKTTLMRQRLKESFGVGGKGAYVSLDDLWFSTHGIRDAIAYFESHGYTHVFIDEVHHFGKDWSLLVKNAYDQFPGLNFVYSGSSLLKLEEGQGDLARRQGSYVLKGLSFREFLAFEGVLDVPPLALEEVLGNHRKIAQDIVASVRVLPLFEKYLEWLTTPGISRSAARARGWPGQGHPGGVCRQR